MSFLKKRREVMLMDLTTLRYIDIPIIAEETRGFIIKKVENLITHFWKGGPGWTGKNVRYLGCKGYALTSWIDASGEQVEGTLIEFLKFIWGKDAYSKMPPELRDPIENRVGVIVTVKPNISVDQNAKYMIDRLQAEAMLQETTTENLEGLGLNEVKKVWTESLMEKIPWMALGGLILYLALHNNIIR